MNSDKTVHEDVPSTETAEVSEEHYLKKELYQLIKKDAQIFDFLQEGSLDGIWYLDEENPEEEWYSVHFKKLFGYEDHEIPNKSTWWKENLFEEDQTKTFNNYIQHIVDPSHPFDQIVRYRHKNGSTVWVRCRGMAIRNEEGKAIRLLGAHTDVTELMEARQQLEDSNRDLMHSNKELEHFAYTASHDLKTPLRGISGLVYLLEKELAGNQSEKVQQYMELLKGRVSKLNAYLEGLLEYSRVKSREGILESIDILALARNLFEELTLPEQQPLFLLPEKPCLVRSRLAPLTRVLRNLLSNAIRYAGEEGKVTLQAEVRNKTLFLSVTDNGPGIASQYHERIFELFQTLGDSSKGKDSHGVGLAIVQKTVESMGGRVRLVSAPGQGASFSVEWPLEK